MSRFQERNEENDFMDAIMSTSVIRHLMNFLKVKGKKEQNMFKNFTLPTQVDTSSLKMLKLVQNMLQESLRLIRDSNEIS